MKTKKKVRTNKKNIEQTSDYMYWDWVGGEEGKRLLLLCMRKIVIYTNDQAGKSPDVSIQHLCAECGIEECLDLFLVLSLKNRSCKLRQSINATFPNLMKDSGKTYLATSGNRASGVTAGIQGVLALVVLSLVGSGQDTRSDVSPGTIVERLLLTPEEVGVGVLVKVRGNLGNFCKD